MNRKLPPVFVLELHANDVHAALGRLLDQTRVAGLKLAAVSAKADKGQYTIRASLDATHREIVDRIAHRIGSVVGVAAIEVQGECCGALAAQCTAP